MISSGDTVFASELVDTTAGIKEFLLAGVERMTCRAHFDEEILTQRGAGFKLVAAATGDLDGGVGGMNIGFHLGRPEVLAVRRAA